MSIELKTNANRSGKPFQHFWNVCVGAGRANEGLRADWQSQLRQVIKGCGFKYLRFHGLFHDDMFIYREHHGRAIYNFQYINTLLDALLEMGIRPFIEFGFCPKDLATETGTVFWWKGNGSPPKDYLQWAELVRRTVKNWIARYGLEEVRSWYFEVWNEPNLHVFFRGTKSQYFNLYKTTAKVLKEIDPHLRVGGPATSNFVPDARFDGETEDTSCHKLLLEAGNIDKLNWQPVWVEQFLQFCNHEDLPVDFISCHPYPTDWALDELAPDGFRKNTREAAATPHDLALIKKIVAQSTFPSAEIHCTEWSSSSSPRDFAHDFLQAATFVVKVNIESIGTVDSLSYWTFTDIFEEGGAGDTIFHGGFGMINLQGIVKPVYHAYRFLNSLGDELLQKSDSAIITRFRETGKLSALAWHYPPEMKLSVPASFDSRDTAYATLALGEPRLLIIELEGLEPNARILIETLDKQNGNALAVWEAMGQPENPSREQIQKLRDLAMTTRKEFSSADAMGNFRYKQMLESWSVILIQQI